MRVIAALLIFAVVCQSALAVTSKSQAKLMMEKVNMKLEKSHFGRALKGMVTIASKLGYDYDDLFDAFAALKAQLLQRLDNENELFDTQTAAHQAAVAQFNADISNYQGQIADGESALQDLNSQLNDYRNSLAQAQQALADNQASLAENQQALALVEEVYKAEVADYQQAAQVIAEADSHLQDAQASYDNASLGDFSLVQVKNTFISFAQKIQAATKNLKAKHQLYVKPVVQAMLQVKAATSQSSIQDAIDALNNLQSYFTQSLTDLTTIYVATVNQLNATIDGLNQVIDILENQTIPNYENQIAQLEAQIQTAEEALALARSNLAASQQALADEEAAYANIVARHEALVDRVNNEYDLVTQAERIIRNAQANHLLA